MLGQHAQVRRKLKILRRVQRLAIAKHGDEKALMAVQNVIQPHLQILRRLRFADDFTRQMDLVAQGIAVKLHKMPVDGNRHKSPQADQHQGGRQSKKDSQPCRERVPDFHVLSWGASSTYPMPRTVWISLAS